MTQNKPTSQKLSAGEGMFTLFLIFVFILGISGCSISIYQGPIRGEMAITACLKYEPDLTKPDHDQCVLDLRELHDEK